MINFIKKNWKDPVWSKVFSGLILSLIGGVGTLIISLYKQIPIAELYDYMTTTNVIINYFQILLTVIILLSLLIPAVLSDVIKLQLKNLKFPTKFRTTSFDLQQYLAGQWQLDYVNDQRNFRGNENVTFDNGNHYKIQGQLRFVLTEIDFKEDIKELNWTKTSYVDNQKHSRETLKIINENLMEGIDDIGFKLKYVKI